MAHSNNFQAETKEFIKDFQYLDSIISEEILQIKKEIQERMDQEQSSESKPEVLSEEILTTLASLSARVKIIEQVMSSGPGGVQHDLTSTVANLVHSGLTKDQELLLRAEDMIGIHNLLDLERDANGISFRWTGASTTTEFQLPVSLDEPKKLRISVFAFIKRRFYWSLIVTVDGRSLKHKIIRDGGLCHVECVLPVCKSKNSIAVGISVPGTFSPRDLGASDDSRVMGIAISEISVARYSGKKGGLFRKLGIRK